LSSQINLTWHSLVSQSDAPDGRQPWLIHFQIKARHAREFLFELAKMREIYAVER
jgi:hypothetical protein